MLREKIKAAWSALVAKRTAGGWCLFILFALFWISDRWDSLNSLIGKLNKFRFDWTGNWQTSFLTGVKRLV